MNQFEALKHYQEQQRQEQAAKKKRASDVRDRKKKEGEQQQFLREQSRRDAELKQSELQQSAERQAQERQQREHEARRALLAQCAESLHIANHRSQEAQRIAAQKLQEQQFAKAVSPINESFAEEWHLTYPAVELKREYPIGKYRVDFVHVDTVTAIELDGHQFHSSRRHRNKDYQRQREIEDLGWSFVRFTGSEVFGNVASCVEIAYARILARQVR